MNTTNKQNIIILLVAVIGIVVFAIGAELFYKWQKINSESKISLEMKGDQTVGNIVDIDLNIDTRNLTINAAEAYLHFDPNIIEVESLDTTGSIFQIWIKGEPKFSNTDGTISFAGGLPTPGFKGKGKLGIIRARLIKGGKTEISFTEKSRMLLNDGEGTAVSLQMAPLEITISK